VAGGADGVPTNQQTKPEEETESGNANSTGTHTPPYLVNDIISVSCNVIFAQISSYKRIPFYS